jgi:hypothetical protein
MDALKQAVAAGFHRPDVLRIDTDLDALRKRADLQKLLAELEAKGKSP